MSVLSAAAAAAKADAERLYSAVKVDLEGRFMDSAKAEHPCRVVEMSTGAMTFRTAVKPPVDETVVVYIQELGRFEGRIDRHHDDGFSIAMSLTELKHRKLAGQLVWIANREVLDLPKSRRHKRIVPLLQWTTVRLSNGKERMARINDVSISGVNIEANISVANVTLLTGGKVMVGARDATVLRVFAGGFVATFDKILDEMEFDETIRL